MAKISKKMVDAAQPGTVRLYIWDDKVSGFGLVVQPSGVKSYCFQYRTPEGRTRRITIGRHGDPYTPDTARAKAKEHTDAVEAGADPLQEKKVRLNALTVTDMLDGYLKSPTFAAKADSTRAIDKGRIERHLKPLLGRKIADKLSADDVRRAFAGIKEGKTAGRIKTKARGLARVTGGEGAARMAIRLLKAAYTWAIEDKLVKSNPAAAVKLGRDGQRSSVVESSEQYAHLFTTIQSLEETAAVRRPVADAIRIIALTGARRGEIAGLRWRHVDLKKGTIELPAREHKTGRKTNEARIIGLPAAAQAIIVRQPEGVPDGLVFAPSHGTAPLTLNKSWRKIRTAAGLSSDLGLHGLRHSLATRMALDGAQAAEIMTVLGHRDLATSQKYIHIAQDMRSELAERAASTISAALTGSPPAEPEPLRRPRRSGR